MSSWMPGFPTQAGQWWIVMEDYEPFVINVFRGEDDKMYCASVLFCGEPLEDQLETYPTIEHSPAEPPP